MIFSLDVRRARKGDCLLLHFGDPENPGLALIDGGPAHVYGPQLKPRLEQIRKAWDLADDKPLPVDLLMVSHIDDDHIRGILELTQELVEAVDARRSRPLKIRSLWHNTFDDIIGKPPEELIASITACFGAASLAGEVDEEELDSHTAKVLASVSQGIQLRNDARKLALQINPEFGGKLIMANGGDPVDMKKGLSFTVAGPMQAELLALQEEHDKFLKKQEKDSKASLAAFTDKSPANLSSLVLLAEAGGKRMLLTGDARGDKILEGLEEVGLLKPGGKMHVNILKVPHHGSDRNMETTFFERVTADHYVFSGDGEHGNPERETMQMLQDARGESEFLIHLTYPLREIDEMREEEWKKERAKEEARKKGKPAEIREEWSAKEHSLEAFFDVHPALARNLRIVEAGKPHVIDLLDKLGF